MHSALIGPCSTNRYFAADSLRFTRTAAGAPPKHQPVQPSGYSVAIMIALFLRNSVHDASTWRWGPGNRCGPGNGVVPPYAGQDRTRTRTRTRASRACGGRRTKVNHDIVLIPVGNITVGSTSGRRIALLSAGFDG